MEDDSDINNDSFFVDEHTTIESITESESESDNKLIFEHIPNYILHNPEQIKQITSIDTRSKSFRNITHFLDAAYSEFMELVSKHHLSDSAGNDILRWFRRNHLRENAILPKNTTQGRKFVNSMNIEHLLYLKTKILKYEEEEYYLHHCLSLTLLKSSYSILIF